MMPAAPIPISSAALRQFIECAEHTPWEDVETGDVRNQCETFSSVYSHYFTAQGIDHVQLFNPDHAFLAVATSDAGIVVFDPTIRQFYPEYPEPYFLGSAEALCQYCTAQPRRILSDHRKKGDYNTPSLLEVTTPATAYASPSVYAPLATERPELSHLSEETWRRALAALFVQPSWQREIKAQRAVALSRSDVSP